MMNYMYGYPMFSPYYVPIHNQGHVGNSYYMPAPNAYVNHSNQFAPHTNAYQNHPNQSIVDQGKKPFVVNIRQAAKQNSTFRTAIWSGKELQVTLMSIPVGGDVGLELHADNDQFLRIEEGQGLVQMGKQKDNLNFVRHVGPNDAIVVPTGEWHNLTNIGNTPLKLYSIYAPPHHPFGTIHRTQAEAEADEH